MATDQDWIQYPDLPVALTPYSLTKLHQSSQSPSGPLKARGNKVFLKGLVEGLRLNVHFTCISYLVKGCCDCKGTSENWGSGREKPWERLGNRSCRRTHGVFSSCLRQRTEKKKEIGLNGSTGRSSCSRSLASSQQWLMAVGLTFRG